MHNSTDQCLLECRKCRRLSTQLTRLRGLLPEYWNKPVPASGPNDAKILIVGLAPGLHGANRTGKPFVGDASGNLLHSTLADLNLSDVVAITNAVKCLPIKNLPNGREIKNCSSFLAEEIGRHARNRDSVVVALGGLAHRAIIRALKLRQTDFRFSHGVVHHLGDLFLVDSYHCSRYNTQTGRLTPIMFKQALAKAKSLARASITRSRCDE